ncbi:HEAT repeat domain-containing protein [Actinomadura kijaniata]|uniref:HEAT repeat domain-containing protein n=1 Tax=Actinomadura kijaniata TaxID=46161 RepID=UPI003F19C27D
MRELALHARTHAGTPYLSALLGELSAGGPYERRTALHLAMAARDLPYVADALSGPDMDLRRAALRAVRTLPVPDDAAARVLDDAPSDLRRAFYRTLRHGGRSALADRLLPLVRERWGDREAAALLPACGPGTVARELPRLAHAVTAWRAVGARHPGAFLDQADRELPGAGHPLRWWRRRGHGFAWAARAEPGRALEVAERHRLGACAQDFPAAAVTALAGADPVRTMRLALTPGTRRWGVPPAFLRHLRACPDEALGAALPAEPHSARPAIAALPPSRRAGVVDRLRERAPGRFAEGGTRWLLDALPAGRAAAEARRILDWHASVWHSSRSRLDDPDLPLILASHLPYEEAEGTLGAAAFGGDPRRRGLARSLLVRCAARTGDAGRLRALLAGLADRTRNEQDPLRGELLTALAQVPPGLLDDACAEPLERLAAAVAEARDTSPATVRALLALAGRVLRHHPSGALAGWAVGVHGRLAARFGAEAFTPPDPEPDPYRRRRRRGPRPARRDPAVPRERERDLREALRPALRAARERRDFTLAVAVARFLGRRAATFGELQDDLRAAVLTAPEPVARAAAALWAGDPAELPAADPSTVVLPEVWRAVAARRTDLLDTVLTGPATGNLADAARLWSPPVADGTAGRWTPAQRRLVRDRLLADAADETRPVAARAAALTSLGRLPGGLDALRPWTGHADIVLAEAATEALGGVDDPDGAAAVLLERARGDASRVAVAALAGCCAALPPSRLGGLLQGMLTGPAGKVTVRKQAARLLERHRPPGAADVLLRAWNDPDLHRDVRIAVAGALRRMPEDPRVWDALGEAAGPYASEPMLRALCQATPAEYAPRDRPRYAALVRRLAVAAEGPGVRFRVNKAFGSWARWYEDGFGDVLAAVADPMAAEGEVELLLLGALLRAGVVGVEVCDVLARLLAAERDPRTHRRVGGVARGIRSVPATVPGRDELFRRAAAVLATDPLHLEEAAGLAVARLDRHADGDPDAGELADEVEAIAVLVRDCPVLASRTGDGLRHKPYRSEAGLAPALVRPAARRLVRRGDLASHLLAVELVGSYGAAADWGGGWRGLLEELRRSPHVEARQGAWNVEAELHPAFRPDR